MNGRLNWRIIKQFSRNNVYGFTLQEVVSEFPELSRIYLSRVLAEMVDQGMLCRLTRNVYHIIPLNADPNTYGPDGYQVAKYIMQNKAYYIGYATALNILGLAPTKGAGPSKNIVNIVTMRQIRPSIRQIGETTCRFIRQNSLRFFGFESMWINQWEQAMVSDLERTIVDIASRPLYGGGIAVLGYALFHARDRIEYDKLFYYLTCNQNTSAVKRVLYLSDLLGFEWTDDHERMRTELGSGISLLDPSEPGEGKIQGRYGLKINVNPSHFKECLP